MSETKRNSRIELLKIIAIIIIVLSHAMPDGYTSDRISMININVSSTNPQYFILNLVHTLGQFGNIIFIICSSWFMLEKNSINGTKILHIVGDCSFISIVFLSFFIIIGYELPKYYIFKQFFTMIYSGCWFVTCYIIFSMLTPILNIIIRSISQARLLRINIILVIMYSLIGFIETSTLFYYTNLVGFIHIYFIVAYVKRHIAETITNRNKCIFMFVGGILGWILCSATIYILGLRIGIFYNRILCMNNLTNPFFVLSALGLFGIANRKVAYNKVINWISGSSLLIYVIHCNRILRDYVRFDIFDYILLHYSYDELLIWVLVYFIVLLIGGVALSILYRITLQRYVHKISENVGGCLLILLKKIETFFIKYK